MRKLLVFCDRCGQKIEEKSVGVVGTDTWNFMSIPFDLCEKCNEEFRKWMDGGKK